MSQAREQRQSTRKAGRYANMPACPRCGKRRALEPAYTTEEGGKVRPDSQWAGHFICSPCIRQESKS